MMYPKVKKITPLNNYRLQVEFSNKVTKIVDFTKKLKEDPYTDLEDINLFNNAKIDAGGYGISWNDDIDIAECELYDM
ncbi:MAG: DUF2442 domain-containing protein [Clostridium sp.]